MRSMFRTPAFLCAGLLLCAGAWGAEVTQTDWSGGPGESGPVSQWSTCFDFSREIDWGEQPGALVLVPAMAVAHTVTTTFGEPAGIDAGDLDGDGDGDIAAVAFAGDQVAWFENDGSAGGWTQHAIADSFLGPVAVLAFDLDGDLDLDIAAAAEAGHALAWWENDGVGGGWTEHVIDASVGPFCVFADDLDGDGDPDLLGAAYGLGQIVWWENVDGTATSWVRHTVVSGFPSAWWAVISDLDGDGDPDVVGAGYGSNTVAWFENSGDGSSWTQHLIDDAFATPNTVYVEDMDGDTDPDVLASSRGGSVAWWENDGACAGWTKHVVATSLSTPACVVAEDLDGDGDSDVVGNERVGNRVIWWENVDGAGTLWLWQLVDNTCLGPNQVITKDIDGDLDPDIIASHSWDDAVIWYELGSDYMASGRLKSSVLATGAPVVSWGTLEWSCTEPAGTNVRVQVRASNDPGDLGTWVEVPYSGEDLSAYISDGTEYLQYRIWLETTDAAATPIFSDIRLGWQSGTAVKEVGPMLNWYLSDTPQPNPSVGGAARIHFALAQSCRLELSLYDVTGRKVRTLAEGAYPEGEHVATVPGLPAGVYFYQLNASEFRQSGKMIVSRP